jgi:membrane protease YdiL (CAAX protease family)
MKQQVKLSGFLTLLCLIAMLISIPYMVAIFGNSPATSKISLHNLLIITIVQNVISAFLFAWLGLIMGKALGLDAPIFRRWIMKTGAARFQKRNVLFSLLAGVIVTLITLGLDYFVFLPHFRELAEKAPKVSHIAGLLTFMQGGVFEEVQVRLFIMTLIVWILFKLFGRKNGTEPWMYWIGIVGAALIFGIGHLPAAQQLFGTITPIFFVRTIVLNGFPGLLFGYLYWKKGLEYAMIAHAIGDIILHGLFS